MRTLIYFFLDPITIGVVLLLLGWAGHRWIRGRWRKAGYGVALAYWIFLLLTPAPKLLVASLESQYTPVIELPCEEAGYIVVLASGFTHDTRLPATGQLNGASLARLIEGIRLWRQCPQATLVVSGPDNDEGISQSVVTAAAARSLGIPASRLQRLDDPVNTAAEAAAVKDRFGTDKSIVLITSAVHLPRAMYWFRHYGFDPRPAPAHYTIKKDSDYRWYTWSPVENIGLFDAYLHETIGLLWARMIS